MSLGDQFSDSKGWQRTSVQKECKRTLQPHRGRGEEREALETTILFDKHCGPRYL
jgi:hypothetical protein